MYLATPNSKKSFQLFKVGVTFFFFLKKGKYYWCKDYHLIHICNIFLLFNTRL
jgi:hypothetical protein